MYTFTAETIARVTCGELLNEKGASTTARHVVIDSREAAPHCLFAALSGARVDGHAFAEKAIDSGASIILIDEADAGERIAAHERVSSGEVAVILVRSVYKALAGLASYQRDMLDVKGSVVVIGVTGSTGKTSTKEFIASIVASKKKVVATRGNQNNELGAPLTVLRVDESTEVLVVEMGMRGRGQVRDLARMARPHIGVISTLGASHIELLGSKEEIARAKSELFEELPDDGLALYRFEEEYRSILEEAARCERISVGFNEASDIVLDRVASDDQGRYQARISGPFGSFEFGLSVPGEHHLINASFGIAIGARLGIDNETLKDACLHATLSGMRFARAVDERSGLTFINDAYNANPTSMEGALRTFARMGAEGKRIAILGDMLELGAISERAHEEVGALCAELSIDALLCVGPLSESTARVARERGVGIVHHFELDRIDDLCRTLADLASEQDIILLKASRGVALERVIEKIGEYRAR